MFGRLLFTLVLSLNFAALANAEVVYTFQSPAEYGVAPIGFQFYTSAILATETVIPSSEFTYATTFDQSGVQYPIQSVTILPGDTSLPDVYINAGVIGESLGFYSDPPTNVQLFDHFGTYISPDAATLTISQTPEPRFSILFGLVTLLGFLAANKRLRSF